MNNILYSVKKYSFFTMLAVIFFYMILFKQWPIYSLLLVYGGIFIILLLFCYAGVMGFIGGLYFSIGKEEKAKKLFKLAIDQNSNNTTIYLNYAVILLKDGNPKDALAYLEDALNLRPNMLTLKNIKLTMSTCYWLLGDLDNAIHILEQLHKNYTFVKNDVLVTLGYMYYLKGDLKRATALTMEAIDCAPEFGTAWDSLGQIHYKTGEQKKAKDAFQKAVNCNKTLVDSYVYLGIIAEDEGELTKAEEYFGKANSCKITPLNKFTKEEVTKKYNQYSK